MRIVNTTGGFDATVGVTEAIKINCEAGFEGIDISIAPGFYESGYKTLIAEANAMAQSYGVPFVQSHGPIPKITTLSDASGREAIISKLRRAIEVSGALGVENMIIHPIRLADGNHEDQLGYNLEFYSEILDDAKAQCVRLAIENMCGYKTDYNGEPVKHVCKTPEELKKYIDAFGTDIITGCLDTGHARISGEAPSEFVRMLGREYLSALHVQDCDGIGDLHTLPFLSKIEWHSFAKALADIDYKGDLTLEAVLFMKNMPKELYPAAAKFMAETAKNLRDESMAYRLNK